MLQVAVIGSQGIPANYGGFESLVENIVGENASNNVHYTVFCSSKDMPDKRTEYKGCTLRYVNLRANGMQSTLYDIISLCKARKNYDTILILGISGCIFLPIFRIFSKAKLVVNIDGLEYRRDKWNCFAKWFLHLSEKMAVRSADVVIADNKGIQDYVTETYHKPSSLIAYGGDHALRTIPDTQQSETLATYHVEKGNYAICVCRIEPENNCRLILEAFSKTNKSLVFIGNWQHSDYARNLKKQFSCFTNIQLLDAIYDLDILYTLRSNAAFYIHGHSAGGTNPSLVEAMFFGIPILAFDCIYNKSTTFNQALYFKTSDELLSLLSEPFEGNTLKLIANEHYMWQKIAKQYEEVF